MKAGVKVSLGVAGGFIGGLIAGIALTEKRYNVTIDDIITEILDQEDEECDCCCEHKNSDTTPETEKEVSDKETVQETEKEVTEETSETVTQKTEKVVDEDKKQ